jgi:aminoglycoside phosphotransferase (APT) family kinase protein
MPQALSDVTADWLSAALSSSRLTAVDVTAVELERVGTGQAGSTYRATPTYAEDRPELPETLVVKLPSEDPALRSGLALGYRGEVAFYAKVANTVRSPIPECFYCDINDAGTEFALVLSDLNPSVQGDQIGGCSDAQALLVVEALAGLHGPTWGEPAWLELSEIAMPKPGDPAAAELMGQAAVAAVEIVLTRLGSELDRADHHTLRSAMSLVEPWLAQQPRYSLMHGDFRADNIMFHPTTDAVTIVDWQTIGVGLPTRDLAYFTGSSLAPDARRRIEADLVDHYHQGLLRHGVSDYDRETCWRDYCIGMIQGPLISLLGCAFATPTDRGDEMFVQTMRRASTAMRELKTLEVVESVV